MSHPQSSGLGDEIAVLFAIRRPTLTIVNQSALVALFADPARRQGAIRSLVGGLTATELRRAVPTEQAIQALIEGLSDPNPQIRWWCVQLLDHLPDDRAIDALLPVLDDPVPRVRRNAAHALGCIACKPTWAGRPSDFVVAKLQALADSDPNQKVRAEARRALGSTGNGGMPHGRGSAHR